MKLFAQFILVPALTLAAPNRPTTPFLAARQSAAILIESVSATGSGCPAGTWTSTIAGGTVQVSFSAYQVATGPSIPGELRERSCDVTLGLTYPAGGSGCTTAAVASTYQGFAELHAGVSATLTTQYQHSPGGAAPANPPPGTIFGGPAWENGRRWQKEDVVGTRVQFGSAGARVAVYTVRTRAFVQTTNGQAFGQSTIDELTVDIERQAAC